MEVLHNKSWKPHSKYPGQIPKTGIGCTSGCNSGTGHSTFRHIRGKPSAIDIEPRMYGIQESPRPHVNPLRNLTVVKKEDWAFLSILKELVVITTRNNCSALEKWMPLLDMGESPTCTDAIPCGETGAGSLCTGCRKCLLYGPSSLPQL